MDHYLIRCYFRKANEFVKHNCEGDIVGNIELTTDRCDVEGILASFNVYSYQIIESDNPLQIMTTSKLMPAYYYERVVKI